MGDLLNIECEDLDGFWSEEDGNADGKIDGCVNIPNFDCFYYYADIEYCDCLGNELDDCDVCGGADAVFGADDCCEAELDDCGVCDGPGEIYECGCFPLPELTSCNCPEFFNWEAEELPIAQWPWGDADPVPMWTDDEGHSLIFSYNDFDMFIEGLGEGNINADKKTITLTSRL